MGSKSYEAWLSIFYNNNLEAEWGNKINSKDELGNILLIYLALEKEITKVKSTIKNEISCIRNDLRKRDYLKKSRKFQGLVESERFDCVLVENKENIQKVKTTSPWITPLKKIDLDKAIYDNESVQSPDLFTKTPELAPNDQIIDSPDIPKDTSPSLISKSRYSKIISPKVEEVVKSNIFDETTIIEGTPEPVRPIKKLNTSKLSISNNKKVAPKHNATLTQMYGSSKPKKKRVVDTNDPSMDIDQMLSFINQTGDQKVNKELTQLNDTTIDGLDDSLDPQKTKNSFMNDYDRFPEKKKFSTDLPIGKIRGKERKKLSGWSCKDCEEFYKGLDLSDEELEKRMDECSRHRNNLCPRDETYQGFWDLTFGPTQAPTSQSYVFDWKKKS